MEILFQMYHGCNFKHFPCFHIQYWFVSTHFVTIILFSCTIQIFLVDCYINLYKSFSESGRLMKGNTSPLYLILSLAIHSGKTWLNVSIDSNYVSFGVQQKYEYF